MSDIVERLLSNSTLVVCPFDKSSPEYWTTPNDKPCKFCGSEPEGPDKCTGADLRVMKEAADEITALRARAEMAEKELADLRYELSEAKTIIARLVASITPLSDAIYNDNGDITFTAPDAPNHDQCISAYFASKAGAAFLNKAEAGIDTHESPLQGGVDRNPEKPTDPEWRIKGGENGADEAVGYARYVFTSLNEAGG